MYVLSLVNIIITQSGVTCLVMVSYHAVVKACEDIYTCIDILGFCQDWRNNFLLELVPHIGRNE